eukprot:TRINITY_DN7390_c0_g2_i2.p1 TRINITY_DN7390_c0_g2~~TRINITY_DN7390_c0_g2_i2.p1  ORF type:complete len:151 (+),score=8.43 TRINITY_DN7390_c0_g2_i2:1366-1818(+)
MATCSSSAPSSFPACKISGDIRSRTELFQETIVSFLLSDLIFLFSPSSLIRGPLGDHLILCKIRGPLENRFNGSPPINALIPVCCDLGPTKKEIKHTQEHEIFTWFSFWPTSTGKTREFTMQSEEVVHHKDPKSLFIISAQNPVTPKHYF